MSAAAPVFNRCRHLFVEGRQCGSRSLRNENFCYYHHTTRIPAPNVRPVTGFDCHDAFELPMPDCHDAIQYGIGEVLRRLAAQQIEAKTASLMLYGLSIASANLARNDRRLAQARSQPEPQAEPVTDIVIDPVEGIMAPTDQPLLPEQVLIAPGRLRHQKQEAAIARSLADMDEIIRKQQASPSPFPKFSPHRTWPTNTTQRPPLFRPNLDHTSEEQL